MRKLTLDRCPCGHPACNSYHVRGLDFGDRGLLPHDQAELVLDAVTTWDWLTNSRHLVSIDNPKNSSAWKGQWTIMMNFMDATGPKFFHAPTLGEAVAQAIDAEVAHDALRVA